MVQQSSVRQEIDRVNQQFVEAYNRGDAGGAAAVYSDDARILPPGSQMISGRQGAQQFWQGAMGMGIRRVALQTNELQISGDVAYEIGTATLHIEPQGGQATTETVKYVVVWRQAGGWKWAVDIWNSNA